MRATRRPWLGGRPWRVLWRPSFWIVLLLPFVFFGWMLAGEVTLGNDYLYMPVAGAQNLRFFTELELEPMWFPHQSGGIPIGGLFYGQYFHFPAWLTSRQSDFWGGDALWWISLRHLLLFGLLHGVFYLAFRRAAGLGRIEALLLSGLSTYSLRNLDALRYSAALEATVYAQVGVLFAMLHVCRPALPLLIGVGASTQLLLTCGYPVVIPFVLLGAVFSFPVLADVAGGRTSFARGGQAAGAALIGALLAAPNQLALSEWIAVNEKRVAHPQLEWAAARAMEPGGILDNLAAPWAADVHAAFGGSTLYAVLLIVVAAGLVVQVRKAWPLVLGLAFAFLYALGTATPLFPLVFDNVPGFSSLRVPGRVFVMLPILLFAGILWLRKRRPGWRLLGGRPAQFGVVVGLVTLAMGVGRLISPPGDVPEFCPARLSDYWGLAQCALWLSLGLFATVALRWAATSWLACVVLVGATALQTGLFMRHGTWTDDYRPSPTREDFHAASHLPLYGEWPLIANNLLDPDAAGVATGQFARFRTVTGRRASCVLPMNARKRAPGVLLPFYLTDAIVCVKDQNAALERISKDRGCLYNPITRVYLADRNCRQSESVTAKGLAQLNEHNRVQALTPNLVTLKVDTPREAVFVTPYVDLPRNWSASIDGSPVPLLPVNGGFLGMRVPPGSHTLSVRYFSTRMVMGYRIAASTAGLLGIALLFRWTERRRVLATMLGAALALSSLRAYLAWEDAFTARGRREAILNHRYPELLSEQISRWRGSPPAVVRQGEPGRVGLGAGVDCAEAAQPDHANSSAETGSRAVQDLLGCRRGPR